MGGLIWTLVGWAGIVAIAFLIYQPLGSFLLFLVLGGYGRKWFRYNAYFYTTASAVVSGLLWGLVMGVLYIAMIRLLHIGAGLSIGLLVWALMATAYSGFAHVPDYARDGSNANLSTISGISSLLYIVISVTALLVLWR